MVALVDNPNPFPVKLTSATFGAVTATPLAGRTCAAANVVAPAPVTWPPRSPCRPTRSTRRSPSRRALEMISTADNGCQGAHPFGLGDPERRLRLTAPEGPGGPASSHRRRPSASRSRPFPRGGPCSSELAVLLWALVPVLLAAEPASAAWAVNGSGPSRAQSVVMPQGAVPTVAKVTDPGPYGSYVPAFVLSWNTATLPAAAPSPGTRSAAPSSPGTSVARTEIVAGGTCLGSTVQGLPNVFVPAVPTAATQTCTDTEAFAKGGVT